MAKKKAAKKKQAPDIVAKALGSKPYPRDLKGYGPNPPDPKWPNGARVAVSFVVNNRARCWRTRAWPWAW